MREMSKTFGHENPPTLDDLTSTMISAQYVNRLYNGINALTCFWEDILQNFRDQVLKMMES